MVIIGQKPHLIINNNMKGLGKLIDQDVGSDEMAKETIHNMKLIVNLHEYLLANVEHAYKKQYKVLCC
jgi:hypothetical protein